MSTALVTILALLAGFRASAQLDPSDSSSAVFDRVYQKIPEIMREFSNVSIQKTGDLLEIEANAVISSEVISDAAGRQRHSIRVARSGTHGVVFRIEYRGHANNVRLFKRQDLDDSIQISLKVILQQEQLVQTTDARARAVFIDCQYGKLLSQDVKKSIDALIKAIEAFDVNNKK